mmetsp:Transcript_17615/g.25270  ORF Transcript_17615/g.25270 Transcript_17615/m.25270 type:complete len:576 (+) Transcript_17615:70-1797(+)
MDMDTTRALCIISSAVRPQSFAPQTPGIKHPSMVTVCPPRNIFIHGQAMQNIYQATNYSQHNAFNTAVASTSLHAEKESFCGKNGNEKHVYLAVGWKHQQATHCLCHRHERDTLLRGYEENGVSAFSQAFTNLRETQLVLEEMNILPPDASATTKKRKSITSHQERKHVSNVTDADKGEAQNYSIFADADEEGEVNELKVAQEQLYGAQRELVKAQQYLANVLRRQEMVPMTCTSSTTTTTTKPAPSIRQMQRLPAKGLATAQVWTIEDQTCVDTNGNITHATKSYNIYNPMATKNKRRPYKSSDQVLKNSDRWMAMLSDLKAYKAKYGNCLVPRSFADNLQLASWVAEQRKQYRLRKLNKPSNITVERIRMLDELGFIWQAQSAAWNRHLNDLRSYKEVYGDCMVPLNCTKYPQLGLWVKEQRRHRSLMIRGRHSHMTKERVQILESVGFCWDSHEAAWWDKFQELQDYKEEFGDCKVPRRYAPNPQLATWIDQQRRQIRLFKDGKIAHMSEKRIKALMELGFRYTCIKTKKRPNPAESNAQEEKKEIIDQMKNSNSGEKKMEAESLSDSDTES